MDVWENNYIKEDDIYTELLSLCNASLMLRGRKKDSSPYYFKAAMLAPIMKGRRYTQKKEEIQPKLS